MTVLMESTVTEIFESNVLLDQKGKAIDIKNSAILVCAGGILPTPMLKKIGIEVETKFGAP